MVTALLTSEHYSIKLSESWTRRTSGKPWFSSLAHLRSCCWLRKCTLPFPQLQFTIQQLRLIPLAQSSVTSPATPAPLRQQTSLVASGRAVLIILLHPTERKIPSVLQTISVVRTNKLSESAPKILSGNLSVQNERKKWVFPVKFSCLVIISR